MSVLSTEDLPLLREALATATPPVMQACLLPRSVGALTLINSTGGAATSRSAKLRCIILNSYGVVTGSSLALQSTPKCQDILRLITNDHPSAVVITQSLRFALPSGVSGA